MIRLIAIGKVDEHILTTSDAQIFLHIREVIKMCSHVLNYLKLLLKMCWFDTVDHNLVTLSMQYGSK